MYSTRLNRILDKIELNQAKADKIYKKITNIYESGCVTGEDKEYIEHLKFRMGIIVRQLVCIKDSLTKNVYSDEKHLFYYDKEIDDIADFINMVDKK